MVPDLFEAQALGVAGVAFGAYLPDGTIAVHAKPS